jgi:hypothetical protein
VNIIESLARELVRVAIIQYEYQKFELYNGSRANVKPVLAMMQIALDAGFKAVGANDIIRTIEALKKLQEFED